MSSEPYTLNPISRTLGRAPAAAVAASPPSLFPNAASNPFMSSGEPKALDPYISILYPTAQTLYPTPYTPYPTHYTLHIKWQGRPRYSGERRPRRQRRGGYLGAETRVGWSHRPSSSRPSPPQPAVTVLPTPVRP